MATASVCFAESDEDDESDLREEELYDDDDDSEDRDEAARHMPTEQFDPVNLRRNRRRLVAIMV